MKQKKEFEIRNGMNGTVVNQCTVNAINNALRLMTPKYLKKHVKGENPNFVRVQAGSMGFRSDDGSETHWEFGGGDWNKMKDFVDNRGPIKEMLGGWDAHMWVTYTDKTGKEITIDPYFDSYGRIAKLWGIKTKNVRNSRVYNTLSSPHREDLMSGMINSKLTPIVCQVKWIQIVSILDEYNASE